MTRALSDVDQPQLAYRYGPEVLERAGPLLQATWSIPCYIEDALRESGQAVPKPVTGLLLLDTGAVATCIAVHTAELLGLRPTRLATGYGAGGEHTNPVFFASLTIDSAGSKRPLVWQGEVQGIPDLEKYAEDLALEIHGMPAHIVGLLGRDLLRFAKLEYDGIVGSLEVRFEL